MKCYTYGISSGSDKNNLQGLMFVFNTLTSGPLICTTNHPRFGGVFFWFGLILNVPVNSCGHVRMVRSPNDTIFLDKLDYRKCSKISNTLKLPTPKIIAESNF